MLYEIIIFVFGLTVGSFLNAVIFRLPARHASRSDAGGEKGESALKGRSYCPHCRKTLKWYDLVPVFSFLFLGGRCRYCKEKISIQYPLVEIATGILFVAIINEFSIFNLTIFNWASIFYQLYIASILIIIFVYDFKYYIIPDKILFPAIIISVFYRILEFVNLNIGHLLEIENWKLKIISYEFLAAILAFSFFLLLVLVSRGRWMGLGDVKLAFFMGLILGWPNILVALFLAFASGAAVGLVLIIISRSLAPGSQELSSGGNSGRTNRRKKNYSLQSQIPFAPFLITGTFIALFYGGLLVNWYLQILF